MIKKDDKLRVSPKVKYKNIKTGELKEGRLIGGPIRNGADIFVKVQVSSGSQGIILVNSKYVYPLFGECSNEEFNNVMKTMKEIENEKCKIMENDNSEESIKNDIQDDKLRWDLLPLEEIEDIVRVYHSGAKKYGPNRWQNLPDAYNRYKAAMFRHLMEVERGNIKDEDTGCLHMAQVVTNALFMLHVKMKEYGRDLG